MYNRWIGQQTTNVLSACSGDDLWQLILLGTWKGALIVSHEKCNILLLLLHSINFFRLRCFAVVHDKKVAEAWCYNLRKILKFIHPLSFWEIASCDSMFYVFTILDYPSVKITFSIHLEYLHIFTLFTEAIKMVWEALIYDCAGNLSMALSYL